MRKIVTIGICIVGIIVLGYAGWSAFYFFANASSNRNQNAAVAMATEIADAELKAKSINGKYVSLKDLADSKLIPPSLLDSAYRGYRFTIQTSDSDFLLKVTPEGNTKGKAFSINNKGIISQIE